MIDLALLVRATLVPTIYDEERTKLRSAYKENLQLFVRRAAALILVPPELVEDVSFNALEDSEEITRGKVIF